MSKKNLSLLMNGFIGENKQLINEQEVQMQESENTQGPQEGNITSSPSEAENTQQMKAKLEAKRKENVGRPKKGEAAKNTKKPQDIRATFIVDPDLLRKVKYISLVEGTLLKDVINEALNNYVDSWEELNKKIRLPKAK